MKEQQIKHTVTDRFLRYIQIPTTSNEESLSCPSTEGQRDLGEVLVQELLALGLEDASIDEHGYVMATLPSNIIDNKHIPVIGFIAHLDTAPDLTTEGIKPRIVRNYQGETIVLDEEANIILSPEDFPVLLNYQSQDLIVTDGHTLLGADDKAGVAEIMSAIAYLVAHKEIKHGTIKVGFTPDEEIGRGADFFDVARFNADYAYTLDGGEIGELEYESFNAANATLHIHGRNVHPGYAKGLMINALEIADELHHMLPKAEQPQYTQDYEGFFHRTEVQGSVDHTKVKYIIRDHDRERFEKRKAILEQAVGMVNLQYGEGTAILDMKDMYYNMGEQISSSMFLVDIAIQAMIDVEVEPLIKPIRGGTDGSRLSFMGLPCPNIFAGGHNFHGRHEFIPITSMEKAVDVILGIAKRFVDFSNENV